MPERDDERTVDGWLSATVEGFGALARGSLQEVNEIWCRAAEELHGISPPDPRLAAATNNIGVANLLLRRDLEGKAQLSRSLRLWQDIRSGLDRMDVPVAGRSSVFHLRLAAQHFDAFRGICGKRYAQLCTAAMDITCFNALFFGERGMGRKRRQAIIESIADGLGPGCPEVAVLRQSWRGASLGSREQLSGDERFPCPGWYAEKPSRAAASQLPFSAPLVGDAQKLVAAAQLTALCDPRLRDRSVSNSMD